MHSAVEAYSCGWSEDLLREQLEHAAKADPQQVSAFILLRSRLARPPNGLCSQPMPRRHVSSCGVMQAVDVGRCAVYLSLIWITITLAPRRSVVRWSNCALPTLGCSELGAAMAA